MTKNKAKDFLKVLGISAFAIALFGAAYIGINTMAFAASTGTVESLPPVAASVVVPTEQETPEGFVEPTVTVTLNTAWSEPSANALPATDAAMIGAEYIWQMFGESIDGKYVIITFSAHPSHTRAYLMGRVYEAEPPAILGRDVSLDAILEERATRVQPLFGFTIDAVTGEWIDISRSIERTTTDEVMAVLDELMRDRSRFDEFYNLRRGGAVPEQLDEYAQIAKEHASLHFANTEVVSAEFMFVGSSGFGFDENGNLISTSRQLIFEVTDNTGRVAEVSFDEATGELFRVSTQQNDFVPGFWFDDGGQGVG